MEQTLVIFEETEIGKELLKVYQEFSKYPANIVYIGCPWPKGDEFQKPKKEGE